MWLRTATGGQVRGSRVVCIEVEQANSGRWVLWAHTDEGSMWELPGEFEKRQQAAARATVLARRIGEWE